MSVDALRGVASMGVVLFHLHLPTAPAGTFVTELFDLGFLGVYLFFVLSGFCIHLGVVRTAVATGEPPAAQFLSFWRRRIRRLYPPYIAAAVLYTVVLAFRGKVHVTPFWWYDAGMHLLMLHNLDSRTVYSMNAVFWTLAIEEQLYLAYFALLWLRNRWGWGRTFVVTALARVLWFVLAFGLHRVAAVTIPVEESAAANWCIWCLGAICVEAVYGLSKLPSWMRSRLAFAAAGAGAFLLAMVSSHARGTPLGQVAWLVVAPVWGLFFVIGLQLSVVAESSAHAHSFRWRLVHGAAAVGLFSYSLYLTHELLLEAAFRPIQNALGNPPAPQLMIALLPAVFAFAWLFYRVVERPFMSGRSAAAMLAPTVEPAG